jgi:hypothetical protein
VGVEDAASAGGALAVLGINVATLLIACSLTPIAQRALARREGRAAGI